jgi:four helix bundle protein
MKGDNIFQRLVNFGAGAVYIIEQLPATVSARHIGQQLVRAATSAGANYQEARGAESRNDFAHKLGVALKEVHEAHYWLQLLGATGWISARGLQPLLRESWELSRIPGSSIRTARAGSASNQLRTGTQSNKPQTERSNPS